MRLPLFSLLVLGLSAIVLDAHPQASREGRTRAPRLMEERAESGSTTNVLLLLADDVGVDMIGAYAEGGDLPATPNIDALAASGVLFRNAWSSPVCSPSRAGILTGRYAFRHGMGYVTSATGIGLDVAELTLPEMLDMGTSSAYAHAAFGKWHLNNDESGGIAAPNLAGFAHFSGTECSLAPPEDYDNWTHITNGTAVFETTYEPQTITDEAIDWMNARTEPFLCYLSFNLAHTPYHRPPDTLHGIDFTGVDPDPEVEPRPYYKAMVEAMDTLIGQVMAEVDPAILNETLILFVGDNGTPRPVTVPPFVSSHGKTTVFEGGVNVPVIVSGPPVLMPGTESAALIQVCDVFATTAEAAGVDYQALAPSTTFDTISLYPYLQDPATPSLRSSVFTELFYPNGEPPLVAVDFDCPDPPTTVGNGLFRNLTPKSVTCQEDLGFAGPGGARLSICGAPLHLTKTSTLTIQGGAPGAMGFLFEGTGFDPIPFSTGTIVPAPGPYLISFVVVLDSDGFYTQSMPHLAGEEFVYYQATLSDPGVPGGVGITNAVKARMFNHTSAIRNDRYKLMVDAYTCEESFYDLVADPFEAVDLLDVLPLGPTEQTNYDLLRGELFSLLGS